MKLFPKIAGVLLATTIVLGVSSCAGNAPNANAQEADVFGLMAANAAQDDQAQPGHHGRGGHFGGPMMGMFLKDLNLTNDQKAKFQALFSEARAQHQQGSQAGKPDFKALHQTLKQAFLSDTFDVNALKGQLQQQLPAAGSKAPAMAAHLIKAWQILTPEQQNTLVSKLEQMEQKMNQRMQEHANKQQQGKMGHGGPFQHMAQQLNLTADQQSKLQALWQEGKPDRQTHIQQMRTVKQQVLAELKGGNPSADKIAALIAPMAQMGRQGLGKHLEKMAALHAVLTPAQRQQLVTLMEQHKGRFGKFGKQGRGGKHGQHHN